MSKKRNEKESMICFTPKQAKVSLYTVYKTIFLFQKKCFVRKRENEELNKKTKQKRKGFLTALATVMKKDYTMSIRLHANELKVHEKTVRTAIKQDVSPDLNSLDYAIWGILENKTNATSHPHIGSPKTATEEE